MQGILASKAVAKMRGILNNRSFKGGEERED